MTKSTSIPLTSPCLSDDDIQAAVQVLKSGQLVSGPVVESFEQQLAAYVGTKYAVCVSSGTAALHLGLLALGIGQRDHVIVPAFGYPASANVVELCGARPIFVDSEPGGFNINPGAIEAKITSRTKAIMVVHNMGWPVKFERVRTIAEKYGIPVFEDSACALGSSRLRTRCGTMGRLAAFSFHPRMILTTGEGGAITTNDHDIYKAIMRFRNHGQPFGKTGDFQSAGFNYRMTDFQAALGLSQLKRFDETLKRRCEIAHYYNENLSKIGLLAVPLVENSTEEVNHQTYIVYVRDGLRDKLIEHLRLNNVDADIGTYSIPHTTFYQEKYSFYDQDFINAKNAHENLISLPIFDSIARSEQDKIIDLIKEFATGIQKTKRSLEESHQV